MIDPSITADAAALATAPTPLRKRCADAVLLMRPHQWIKNTFVLAPLFFTPAAVSIESVRLVLLAVACFCLVSSAVYILNDYCDREADRRHPLKRLRPLAAGTVSPWFALVMGVALTGVGMALAVDLSPGFAGLLLAYLVLNVAYSLGLKHRAILDVLIIGICFVLRVEAGAVLVAIRPSAWIIVCTFLLALFLALAKRRDDLVHALDGGHRRALDGYNRAFVDAAFSISLAALVVAYMIYTTDAAVMARMGSDRLYLTIPFVMAGILRYLQITLVEERSGSPTRLVLTDGFLLGAVLGWLGSFAALIYL